MKPTTLKFPKAQKGRLNWAIKTDTFHFGEYAIIANQPAILKSSHISTIILAMKRYLKKEGKIYLRIFTHTPVTKKPIEVRMGKGKGSVNHFITKVQTGSFLFELQCNVPSKAISALAIASSKLPLSTKILTKKV